MDSHAELPDPAATIRAVTEELRRRREAKGWTQDQLSSRLSSHRGRDSVRPHDAGEQDMTVLYFVEVCDALDEKAGNVLAHALDRVESDKHRHEQN